MCGVLIDERATMGFRRMIPNYMSSLIYERNIVESGMKRMINALILTSRRTDNFRISQFTIKINNDGIDMFIYEDDISIFNGITMRKLVKYNKGTF